MLLCELRSNATKGNRLQQYIYINLENNMNNAISGIRKPLGFSNTPLTEMSCFLARGLRIKTLRIIMALSLEGLYRTTFRRDSSIMHYCTKTEKCIEYHNSYRKPYRVILFPDAHCTTHIAHAIHDSAAFRLPGALKERRHNPFPKHHTNKKKRPSHSSVTNRIHPCTCGCSLPCPAVPVSVWGSWEGAGRGRCVTRITPPPSALLRRPVSAAEHAARDTRVISS